MTFVAILAGISMAPGEISAQLGKKTKLDYKSNEKTAYFDLFISFISIYVEEFQNAIELSSVHEQKKLMIPYPKKI